METFKTEIGAPDVCVYLRVPDATLLRRVVDKVGDDDEEFAWESIKASHVNVKPVLEELKKRDKLLDIHCDAADGVDEVFEKVNTLVFRSVRPSFRPSDRPYVRP